MYAEIKTTKCDVEFTNINKGTSQCPRLTELNVLNFHAFCGLFHLHREILFFHSVLLAGFFSENNFGFNKIAFD